MRQILLVISMLLATCPIGLGEQKDLARELTIAEQKINKALIQGDWRSIQQLYADDVVFTNADGSVDGKAQTVELVKSGTAKFDGIDMTDVKVQDLGKVGVVTGKLVEKGHYDSTDLSGTYRFTDVWARRDGKWLLVAGQETRYTPEK